MEEIFRQIGLRGDLSNTLLTAALVLVRVVPIVSQTPFLGGKLSDLGGS